MTRLRSVGGNTATPPPARLSARLCGHEDIHGSNPLRSGVAGGPGSCAGCDSSVPRRGTRIDARELSGKTVLLKDLEHGCRRQRHQAQPDHI